jgi:hypothetical protein
MIEVFAANAAPLVTLVVLLLAGYASTGAGPPAYHTMHHEALFLARPLPPMPQIVLSRSATPDDNRHVVVAPKSQGGTWSATTYSALTVSEFFFGYDGQGGGAGFVPADIVLA